MLGTVPSLVRTWKGSDCMANLDWSSVRYVLQANVHFFSSYRVGVLKNDFYWQRISLNARAGNLF